MNSELSSIAAARRAELSSSWLTADQLGPFATEQCKCGQLLAVYLTEPSHHFRYPIWQFQSDGHAGAHFVEILSIMREYGTFLDKDGRSSGWGEVEWFLSPHVLLNNECPADALRNDPQAVLNAARIEYIEDNDSGGF